MKPLLIVFFPNCWLITSRTSRCSHLRAATPRLALTPETPSHLVTCTNLSRLIFFFYRYVSPVSRKCCCNTLWGQMMTFPPNYWERLQWVIRESPSVSELIRVMNSAPERFENETSNTAFHFFLRQHNERSDIQAVIWVELFTRKTCTSCSASLVMTMALFCVGERKLKLMIKQHVGFRQTALLSLFKKIVPRYLELDKINI